MSNQIIPYVAIIGGIWNLNPNDLVDAKKTAQEIGEALATSGMGMVVYFSDPNSLEPYVVAGYVNALAPGVGAGSIKIRFAESQKNQVQFAEQLTKGDIFQKVLFPSNDWEAPFYRSLVDADGVDAVVLMAGATSTLIAGQIALARPLPTLAIDKFNGSAAIIRSELARKIENYPSSATHTIPQSITWLRNEYAKIDEQKKKVLEKEIKFKELEALSLKTVSQKSKTLWATISFIFLLIILFFGIAKTPMPQTYSYLIFIGLVASGMTGAMGRSVFWGDEKNSPATSLLLGAIAGFVVGLAYLIPQFIGAPGVLKHTATDIEPTDKIQFISAILVALSAGVGFDTVFTRLKKQADDLPVGISGK